ncbi:MAG: hypothetical protein FWD28_06490 [Treponema sp.]|nr:hypothetical protein [Treponema sp.]
MKITKQIRDSFFIIIFFVLLAVPVYSQDITETITSIEIIGLTRTKLQAAKYPLEKFIGQERSAFDQNEVFAAIKNTSVLEPISAELIETEDGLILQVTVEEKWTLFPFPMIFAGSGETIYGLFLYEANAFGLRDMAVIGGMFGSFGYRLIAIYNHTPNRKGIPGFNCLITFSSQEHESTDRYETIQSRFDADRFRVSLGINYSFNDTFTGLFNASFSNIIIKESSNAVNPPAEGSMVIGFSPGLSIRSSNWDGYFLSQQSLSLDYRYNLAIEGDSYHQAEYSGIFEYSIIPGFRMCIKSGGMWKSSLQPLFEEGAQKSQVSILPRNYSAIYYTGFSAGLEKYIYKNQWGILSVMAAYQCVFSFKVNSNLEFDHGIFGGMFFYLSRLALPAIGVGGAYNFTSGVYKFNFSAGMSF